MDKQREGVDIANALNILRNGLEILILDLDKILN